MWCLAQPWCNCGTLPHACVWVEEEHHRSDACLNPALQSEVHHAIGVPVCLTSVLVHVGLLATQQGEHCIWCRDSPFMVVWSFLQEGVVPACHQVRLHCENVLRYLFCHFKLLVKELCQRGIAQSIICLCQFVSLLFVLFVHSAMSSADIIKIIYIYISCLGLDPIVV